MAGTPTFSATERERAIAWKRWTRTLPDGAWHPAGYVGPDGVERGGPYDFCLPPEHAALSLLPEVREPALANFLVQPAPEPRLAHLPQPAQLDRLDRLDDWLTPTPRALEAIDEVRARVSSGDGS
ncbi:MAG: hypothetical protein M3503_07220 [Actinomycetota bacterium]|nr:hypothetical protein [Actinomycetota bacterium]